MYFNVTDLGPKDTVKSFMAADTRREMKNDPKTSVSTGESIQVGDRSFPVLEFSLGGNSGHEAVAYIGESQVLVMIVISSLNEEIFRRDYPSFVKLVKTYAFLTSDVRIKTK